VGSFAGIVRRRGTGTGGRSPSGGPPGESGIFRACGFRFFGSRGKGLSGSGGKGLSSGDTGDTASGDFGISDLLSVDSVPLRLSLVSEVEVDAPCGTEGSGPPDASAWMSTVYIRVM